MIEIWCKTKNILKYRRINPIFLSNKKGNSVCTVLT